MNSAIKCSAIAGLGGAIVAAIAGRFDTAAADLAFQWGIGTMIAGLVVLFIAILCATRGIDLVDFVVEIAAQVVRALWH